MYLKTEHYYLRIGRQEIYNLAGLSCGQPYPSPSDLWSETRQQNKTTKNSVEIEAT